MLGQKKYHGYLLWVALVTVTMALAMAIMLVLQLTQRQAIRQSSHLGNDSITAMAFQFEREFLRFRQVLDSRVKSRTPPDMEELTLRLNIFVSRLGLLRDNPSIAILQGRPEYTAVIPAMEKLVERTDAVLAEEEPNREALVQLLAEFNALGPEVQALSMSANSQVSTQLEGQGTTMLRQNDLIVWLTLAQLIVLLVASGALAVRQRRQEQERQALQRLTDDLVEANRMAESANRGKSQFLANMSHELRTPFNGILGMLGLLGETRLNAQQADYVATVRGSANHLLALLNDILDVSALDVGKMTINPAPVQLGRLLHDVDALMRPLAKEKQLEFVVMRHHQLPDWVEADGTRIKQILLNLVSNAIKFSAQGRILLDVTCQPVDDPDKPASVTLLLRVSDQGIGMDAATLECLFQRFTQGDNSISRRFGGTGLGLEISRSLARLMGGDITAQSQLGEGSQFSFELTLPCIAAPEGLEHTQPAPLQITSGPVSANQLDVLVAEDHPVNRKYMESLLTGLGHKVRFVEDGAQAVAEAQRAVPDVLFMDVHMPVMDGLQAAKALRTGGGAAAGTYIVALTADAFAESRELALASGMDAFLSKPVRMDQIESLLQQRFGQAAPAAPAPVARASVPARRFRAGDVAEMLDMQLLGEVCVAISLDGYRSLLNSFFSDESDSFGRLLADLDRVDLAALHESAHAFKGACASLGFRGMAALASGLEQAAPRLNPQACAEAAQQLRHLFPLAHALCQRMGLTEVSVPAY